ncbi:MAG: anti-CBASS protein Acb1 family protein [Marinomonas gallaica]
MSELTANHKQFAFELNRIKQSWQRSYDFAQMFGSSDTKHQGCFDSYGWPETIDFNDYYSIYSRSTYAAAIIDKVVDKCWQNNPWVMGSEDRRAEQMNAKEKKFYEFAKRFNLWYKLQELDRMQSIGQYAGLLVEVRDGKQLSEPMERVKESQISNFLVLTEGMLQPLTYDENSKSDRYKLPLTYQLDYTEYGDRNPQSQRNVTVHHSRLIIWAEGAVNDGIFGRSRLMNPFNTLLSLQKISGAGPEGFWQSTRGSFTMTFDKDADLNKLAQMYGVSLAELPDELGSVVEDFRRNYDNVIAMQGGEIKPLTFSLPSPKDYLDGLKDELAATGIPLTEIIGQQVDERSSTENGKQFAGYCEARQNGFLDRAIRKTLDWFMTIGIVDRMPFHVCWEELYQPSMEQKLELVAKMMDANLKRAQIVQTLATVGADDEQGLYIFSSDEVRDAAGMDALESMEMVELDEVEEEQSPD